MADPITWGLINLVKKGVKGVQTTLDGVSDKVNGLPDSLDADFTEVKNAIAEVETDVEGVKSDTSSIKNTVDTNSLLVAGSAIKSIQKGVQNLTILDNAVDCNISISTINPDKSFCIIDPVCDARTSGYMAQAFVKEILSNQITVTVKLIKGTSGGTNLSAVFSWQVIEFY